MLTCKKRKRRNSFIDEAPWNTERESIAPNPVSKITDEDVAKISEVAEVSSSKEIDEREAKFLNYWMTTTVISTFTSFTATSSLASLVCTPDGYTDSGCPGNG